MTLQVRVTVLLIVGVELLKSIPLGKRDELLHGVDLLLSAKIEVEEDGGDGEVGDQDVGPQPEEDD